MKKVIILATTFVALILGFVIFGRNREFQFGRTIEQPTPGSQSLQTFHSQILKFNLQAPSEFQTEEKGTRVTLKSSVGQVVVNRIGTNFDSLQEYLANLDSTHNTQILEEDLLLISGNETIKRTIKYPTEPAGTERHYKIYVDNWVYTISTTSESLYDNLDQIAQSFRYTP